MIAPTISIQWRGSITFHRASEIDANRILEIDQHKKKEEKKKKKKKEKKEKKEEEQRAEKKKGDPVWILDGSG